ncbi:hypothetical protein [Candidatus Poriferisodalis sp.]|uniref:hypothetical protein n=1 Tax=Candidatus Poriferisodalis sp. TaxID=3101277 RepID=UPI003B5C18C6
MDSPVTKLMFIAAAVAAAALVVAVMWTTLSSNAPQTDDSIKYDKIESKNLCDAVGGTWGGTPAACTG